MRAMLFLISVLLLGVLASAAQPEGSRPNILFVFSDDHALEAISAYRGRFKDIAPTPHLDRIAREGAIFNNSFCANSICGPSRACILTGKHSHINGFRTNRDHFNGNQWSFQKDLRQAGYTTALIGKWHLHGQPQGFDHWEIFPGQGNYYNPDFITMDAMRHREQGYCTDLVTDKAVAWLDGRDKTKPFLLMCQHKAPHRTFAPALRHLGAFDGVEFPEPSNLFDDYATRSKTLVTNQMSIENHFRWTYDLKVRPEEHEGIDLPGPDSGFAIEYNRMTPAQKKAWDAHYGPLNQQFIADYQAGNKDDPKTLTRWKYARYLQNYLATIKSVDESVGRLLDYLDKHDLANNTLVIYSSDQGFYLGEHGWYDKRWMFEESFKMPFLIRWPGVVTPNTRPEAMIQNIDYAPTFLEAAGLSIPTAVQGRSLLPVLRDTTTMPADWRESLYYHYYEAGGEHNVPIHYGVRTQRYKLIHFPATDQWNLFDLEADPHEMLNIYERSENRGRRDELKRELDRLRKQYQL
ncbi:Choline-sulfatase [Novipirellula galeiformis]|uniref:Choline-sulfatase n=1 Tax=Novipirellula galeiformis TaxID=2528004 RepID=A0A5C6CFJ2_9BACT|nr:sulfatase [Novipirellula galeiformis]TWU22294.1 Choline-sulfatase [Novipirellula galeiformis]